MSSYANQMASDVRVSGPRGIERAFNQRRKIYETWLSWLTISANQFSSIDL
jgi:hypothetical protein